MLYCWYGYFLSTSSHVFVPHGICFSSLSASALSSARDVACNFVCNSRKAFHPKSDVVISPQLSSSSSSSGSSPSSFSSSLSCSLSLLSSSSCPSPLSLPVVSFTLLSPILTFSCPCPSEVPAMPA